MRSSSSPISVRRRSRIESTPPSNLRRLKPNRGNQSSRAAHMTGAIRYRIIMQCRPNRCSFWLGRDQEKLSKRTKWRSRRSSESQLWDRSKQNKIIWTVGQICMTLRFNRLSVQRLDRIRRINCQIQKSRGSIKERFSSQAVSSLESQLRCFRSRSHRKRSLRAIRRAAISLKCSLKTTSPTEQWRCSSRVHSGRLRIKSITAWWSNQMSSESTQRRLSTRSVVINSRSQTPLTRQAPTITLTITRARRCGTAIRAATIRE